MNYSTDDREFDRCWSSAAGELSATKAAIVVAERRAGEAYIARQDVVANALRDCAAEFGRRRDELDELVSGYIKESQRRAYERRRLIGG